jgi:hypothetical protein
MIKAQTAPVIAFTDAEGLLHILLPCGVRVAEKPAGLCQVHFPDGSWVNASARGRALLQALTAAGYEVIEWW